MTSHKRNLDGIGSRGPRRARRAPVERQIYVSKPPEMEEELVVNEYEPQKSVQYEEQEVVSREKIYAAQELSRRIPLLRSLFSAKGEEKNQNYFPAEGFFSILKQRKVLWGGGGIILFVFLFWLLLSTVFAELTVSLKPKIEKTVLEGVTISLDANVSKVDASRKMIPAELFEFAKAEQSEFSATGHQEIQEKARGAVKIYNQFSSAPQALVGGTRFMTDGGALYRLPKSIIIPGAKIEEGKVVPTVAEADLVADKAGEDGNASGEIALKIPAFKGTSKYDGFYAVASGGFAGGFSGEAVVVTKEDIRNAEESTTKKVFDELRGELLQKIPHDFKIVEGLTRTEITKVESPRENARVDHFTVKAEGRGRAFAFRESDLFSFLQEIISAGDQGKTVLHEHSKVVYAAKNLDFEKKRAELTLSGGINVKSAVSREDVAELLHGKDEASMVVALKAREELGSFSLSFFPPWLYRAPSDSTKIKIIIEEP